MLLSLEDRIDSCINLAQVFDLFSDCLGGRIEPFIQLFLGQVLQDLLNLVGHRIDLRDQEFFCRHIERNLPGSSWSIVSKSARIDTMVAVGGRYTTYKLRSNARR